MVDSDLGLTLVFNGCIYNYQDLRAELEAVGYQFFSTADSEVVIKAFHRWGTGCVDRFKGMFAFAIADRDTGVVTLARDRLGIKPLYLAETPGRLRFASTVRALLDAGDVDTELDRYALHHYMSFHSVVPAPRTIYRGVRKLPPATVRVIQPDGSHTDTVYWTPLFERDPTRASWSMRDWQDALMDALRTAVERRMVADVPVGVLLSGGIDSSIVVALLAEQGQHGLATFSIGFDSAGGESGDEYFYSDLIAKSLRHRSPPHPYRQLAAAAGGAENHCGDERTDGQPRLRRVLSALRGSQQVGQGGAVRPGRRRDPGRLRLVSAAGERRPRADHRGLRQGVLRPRPRRRARDLRTGIRGSPAKIRAASSSWRTSPRRARETAVDAALRLDTQVMLVDDPVKRVDTMTMAWGLEARVPFLDHDFVELAATCPPELKLASGGKGVLKDASRALLPAEVIDRTKGYFPVPGIRHLHGEVLDMVRDALTNDAARARGLYRPETVEALLAAPNDTRTMLGANALWQLAVLEMWLQSMEG